MWSPIEMIFHKSGLPVGPRQMKKDTKSFSLPNEKKENDHTTSYKSATIH